MKKKAGLQSSPFTLLVPLFQAPVCLAVLRSRGSLQMLLTSGQRTCNARQEVPQGSHPRASSQLTLGSGVTTDSALLGAQIHGLIGPST
jgi:hypothetical protein